MDREMEIEFYAHLFIFIKVFKSMNEFGLILSFKTLKCCVIISYQTVSNRVIL